MKMLKYLFVGFMVLGLVSMFSAAQALNVWNVPGDFDTIQAAVDSDNVVGGDMIMVAAGLWDGAIVNKPSLSIIGEDGAQIKGSIIMGFPYINASFMLNDGADNTKISNFSFDGVGVPIWGNQGADGIIVSHLTINSCVIGISNIGGSSWEIIHNKITGSPIGVFTEAIQINGYLSPASNNLVAFNDISLDYNTGVFSCGIFLISNDDEAKNNKIVQNKVNINRGGGVVGPDWGIFLGNLMIGKGTGNYIGFNDCRGCEKPLLIAGEDPLEENYVSRNIGDVWIRLPDFSEHNLNTGENRGVDPEEVDLPYPACPWNPQPPQ